MCIGIVVIGRNEAERLPLCFASLPDHIPVCYVDSGSLDDSLNIAELQGADTVQLSDSTPFSAARARNAGFERLLQTHPHLDMVFFIDGDCILASGFLPQAMRFLANNNSCSVVVGNIEENNESKNLYGMLASLEWKNSTDQEITNFDRLGGIMLVRAADFKAIGGFDSSFIAGEESDLGIRFYLSGRKTFKIGHVMARHDMEMQHFGQWWRRSVRAGQALAHRFAKHGHSPLEDCKNAVRSTIVYGFAVPLLTSISTLVIGAWGLMPMATYAYLWSRFFSFYRHKGASTYPASIAATFGVIAKFANVLGLFRFHVQTVLGEYSLIEYK